MSTDNNQPQAKQFSLRPVDAERLVVQKEHLDALFSIQVSLLASDRFGYQVTEHTKFRLSPDLKTIDIWEDNAAPVPGAAGPGIVTG